MIGTKNIDKVIDINQSPIGRTPRSNPATYTGCFTPIRDWYARLILNHQLEVINQEGFLLMLKVGDVNHVRELVSKQLKCIF